MYTIFKLDFGYYINETFDTLQAAVDFANSCDYNLAITDGHSCVKILRNGEWS